MILRSAAAALLIVSLLVGGAVSCGKYGSPERPGSPGPPAPEESP